MPIVCLAKPQDLCNGNIEQKVWPATFAMMVRILNAKSVYIAIEQVEGEYSTWRPNNTRFGEKIYDLCGARLFMQERYLDSSSPKYRVLYNSEEFPGRSA